MKILFLYAEVMGYTMATIRALVEYGAEVHVVHWDTAKLTPYRAESCKNVYFYPRSAQTFSSLCFLAQSLNPDIIFVSGWSDKLYLSLSLQMRQQGRPVVSGFDNQWNGTPKQHLAAALGHARFFARYFSHAWVAGVYQYEYARRIGFRRDEIIANLYSADVNLYGSGFLDAQSLKAKSYPYRFLFVGRLEPIKGLDVLLKAWMKLVHDRRGWELHLVGNGSLSRELASTKDVVLKGFMTSHELVREAAEAGCFVLPSKAEPWGVVVHEFAAAGLPLLVSDVVGAGTSFVVPGWNGYSFRANDPSDLARAMEAIINTPVQLLIDMGYASHKMSARISPKISAASLLSIVLDQ